MEKIKTLKIDGRQFVVRMTCAECSEPLNESKEYDFMDMQRHWTMLVMSSGFNSGRCPKCKYSTFSDLNIGTKLKIYDVKTNEQVDFALFKLTSGGFYHDDHDKLCLCDDQRRQYSSKKYPHPVHGTCGRFIKKYKPS